jgi:hypothetical protein
MAWPSFLFLTPAHTLKEETFFVAQIAALPIDQIFHQYHGKLGIYNNLYNGYQSSAALYGQRDKELQKRVIGLANCY